MKMKDWFEEILENENSYDLYIEKINKDDEEVKEPVKEIDFEEIEEIDFEEVQKDAASYLIGWC